MFSTLLDMFVYFFLLSKEEDYAILDEVQEKLDYYSSNTKEELQAKLALVPEYLKWVDENIPSWKLRRAYRGWINHHKEGLEYLLGLRPYQLKEKRLREQVKEYRKTLPKWNGN